MDRMNLFASDLDGTLLGDDEALRAFLDWFEPRRNQFRLVYTSGRFIDSVMGSIERNRLPMPDAIVGGVGSEIYDVAAARRIVTWPPSIFEWNPYLVRSIGEMCRELTLQPEHMLSHYKVSFYGWDLDKAFIDRLMLQMSAVGLRVSMVYSSKRDLDILPAEATKGGAAAFLANRWRIDPRRVIVAGDSGNDADMFRPEFRGIIVANAQTELKELNSTRIYHASSMFARGVLEGLRYWLQQSVEQPPGISRRRNEPQVDAAGLFSKSIARHESIDTRNQLPDANFPWMLL